MSMSAQTSKPSKSAASGGAGTPDASPASVERRRSQTARKLSGLPVFNKTALNLVTIPAEADSARDEFELAFRSDPTLAADLLILANSPEFGLRAHVTTIPHAISLLGLERVRELACSIALRLYVRNSAGVDSTAWWKHSMASAALATHIAKTVSRPLPLLPTSALLHDMGNLGLQLTLRKEYVSMNAARPTDVDEALKMEKVLFGMDHCEAGALMMRTWGFPDILQRYVEKHHGGAGTEENPVLGLVQATCGLAEAFGYPEFPSIMGGGETRPEELVPAEYRSNPEFAPERLAEVIRVHLESAQSLK